MHIKTSTTKQEIEYFLQNICYLQKKHQFSSARMAEICGICPASLRKIQKGMLPNISVEVVWNLAKYFHIPPADLFRPMK